ncbi:MAG: hypothetical protein ACM3ML_00110 [Micromonosporaceae bacterium]
MRRAAQAADRNALGQAWEDSGLVFTAFGRGPERRVAQRLPGQGQKRFPEESQAVERKLGDRFNRMAGSQPDQLE